jgi:hypothetical protein
MKKILAVRALLAAALLWAASSLPVVAQTAPGWSYGYVPTVAQWNAVFAAKQDYLGAPPLLTTGGTMTGKLATSASTTVRAGFNVPAGTAPTAPVDGDMWSTTSGLFVRINGTTVGPLSGPSSGSFAATAPLSVSFPASVVTYACATCGVTTSPLSQFASTTSAQLAGVLSDETGTGVAVFGTGPTLTGVTITTSFTATGLVGLTNLATQATNTVLANVTAGAASPTAYAMSSCIGAANALQWVTNTGFTCAAITAAASSIAVGTTSITSGTTGRVLYDNGAVLGEYTITGTAGSVVMSSSPTIASPTFSGTVAGAGTIPNSVLVNSATTVNGQTCTLGSTCTVTAVASTITVGTTLVSSGSDQFILYNNAGTLANKGTTGTGNVVQQTSASLVTPALGVATATSLATGGCTIGTNGLCVSGSTAITSSSATALAVGLNGSINPVLQVDASTALQAAGLKITGGAAGAGTALQVIDSATNSPVSLNAKGSGTTAIASSSTGATTIGGGGGGVTISSALTYGGVTLANSVTGTGSMALSASPTFTGTLSSAAHVITVASTTALAVGANGTMNPVLQVDTNTASVATGIKITGAAAGGNVSLAAISSGTNEALFVDAKGSGTIIFGNTSTGGITLSRAVTFGASGAVVGTAAFVNATSGSITITPPTGALGTRTLTLPAATDTLAGQAIANGGTGGSLTASDGGIVYSDSTRLQILAGTATAGQCLLSNSNSAPAWGSCAGGAAVSSVSNSDSTLTISPTTGAVVASLNLTNANVWTGVQSFTASGIKLKGSSTGYTTFASANAGASNYTATFQAASGTLAYLDLASQTISGGATVTSNSIATGSFTVDCGARPLHYVTNNGAYTITAPAADGSCMVLVTNGASAGATTFSGFTVSSNTGDSLTTTNTSKFVISVVRINGTSTYIVKALQ